MGENPCEQLLGSRGSRNKRQSVLGAGNLHSWVRAGQGRTGGAGTSRARTLSLRRARAGLHAPRGPFQLRIVHDFEAACRQGWPESSLCQTQQIPPQAGAAEHNQDPGGAKASAQPLSPPSARSRTVGAPPAAPGSAWPGGPRGWRRARCVLQQALTELAWAPPCSKKDRLCTGNLSHVPYQPSCWYFTHTSCRKKPLLGAAEFKLPMKGEVQYKFGLLGLQPSLSRSLSFPSSCFKPAVF